jgi:hypothetical protein
MSPISMQVPSSKQIMEAFTAVEKVPKEIARARANIIFFIIKPF